MEFSKKGRVCVVVLGDIGRSPRMQFHAMSLADQAGLEVDLVGYAGSQPHESLLQNPKIHLHYLWEPPVTSRNLPRAIYLLSLPLKLLLQVLSLFWTLWFSVPAPDFFLVQNPPSLPTLTVLLLLCWIHGCRLIVDWHNFGFSLLALRLGPRHPLVRLHKWYEASHGRLASFHLCVTEAMKEELEQTDTWGMSRVTVMYDKPPQMFRPITVEETHELFRRLHGSLTASPLSSSSELTLLTRKASDGKIEFREDRPAVVVSSTSWTADEDFSVLLEAAVLYDRRVAAAVSGQKEEEEQEEEEGVSWLETLMQREEDKGVGGDADLTPFPKILFLITGKGPERAYYEDKISSLRLHHVAFRTLWLSPEDYPLLLASASVGVSLHHSSSGFDLPMKVVDMLGCGTPVVSISYSCIGELVKNGANGLLFSSSFQLAQMLMDLFERFPRENVVMTTLKEGAVKSSSAERWNEEWEQKVSPIVRQILEN